MLSIERRRNETLRRCSTQCMQMDCNRSYLQTVASASGNTAFTHNFQLNNLLLLSKIHNNHYDFNFSDRFPPKSDLANTRSRLFECTRPAKFVCENKFWFHAKRLANLVSQKVDFTNTIGLKGRLLQWMWEHFEKRFDDSNPCSWKILCDCTRNNCRKMSN